MSVVGTVAAAATFFVTGGNAQLAFQAYGYGSMAEGILNPPKAPHSVGPRLGDLTQQTATYGAVIPRVYGTTAILGNVFWLENNALKEVATEQAQGGGKGGGGGATQTTFSYYATFAVGLCEGEIQGVRRIWLGGKLWYDAGSNDPSAIAASNAAQTYFALHTGSETQAADTRMQATLGVANTPAYRGLAYLVFKDLPLANYGNSLAGTQVKVEVVNSYTWAHQPFEVTEFPSLVANNVNGLAFDPITNSIWISHYGGLVKFNKTTNQISVAGPTFNGGRCIFEPKSKSVWALVINAPTAYRLDVATGSISNISLRGYGADIVFDDVTNSVWIATQNFGGNVIQGTNAIQAFDVATGIERDYIAVMDNGSDPNSYGPRPTDLAFDKKNERIYWIDRNNVYGNSFSRVCYASIHTSKSAFWTANSGQGGWFDSMYPIAPTSTTPASAGYIGGGTTEWIRYQGVGVSNPTKTPNGICIADGLLGISHLDSGVGASVDFFNTTTNLWFGLSGFFQPAKMIFEPISNSVWVSDWNNLWRIDLASRAKTNFSLGSVAGCGICLDVAESSIWVSALRPNQTLYALNRITLTHSGFGLNPVGLGELITHEITQSALLAPADFDVTALTASVRGFRIGSVASIRSGLQPLQGAFPFDVIQHGYTIAFKPRGGTSVATIDYGELDARSAGQAEGVQLTNVREMDSMLPKKVSVKHLDFSREYDVSEQYAERLNTDAVSLTALDLPVVFTAAEAAQKAEMLLYLYWLERCDVSFKLPPTYNHLEPADIVTIVTPSATYVLRLVSVNYTSDGRVECVAKYHNPAVYSPTSLGAEGASTGQVLTHAGLASYVLLDVPLLQDIYDMAGFPIAMTGLETGWSGGVVYSSPDAGQTWNALQGFGAPGSTIGTTGAPLAAHDGLLIDKASRLAVTLLHGATLASVTEGAMLGGANYFAYGADTRWEIIAAQNCVQQLDGSYVLTDLLRGRMGTEWATGLHQTGDTLVLLASAGLRFVSTNLNQIGLEKSYRGITNGDKISADSNRAFAYRAVNLRCLSPVGITGSIAATGDWTLGWTRRTRLGGEWRDSVDAPLGEAVEAYDIEIFGDASRAALKRTLHGNAPSVAYSAAQQVTDFGGLQSTLYLRIYQLSATTGRGYPLTATITR